MSKMRYYRFETGTFVEAKSFEEAKKIYIGWIEDEEYDEDNWSKCTCLGLSHRYDCPEAPFPLY